MGDAERRAVGTLLDMPSEASGPAHVHRAHDAVLDTAEMSVVRLTTPPRGGHRQFRDQGEAVSACRHHLKPQPVERADRAADRAIGNFRVARPCCQTVYPI